MTSEHSTRITRNGLAGDQAKDREWRQRSRDRYAAKQRQRRNEARMTTKIKPARTRNDWPASVRKLARQRSGGWCEIGGNCRATQLHHRKRRDCRDHRICNALHVCAFHHDLIGNNRTLALINGWIVKTTADPARISVLIASGDRVMLTDRGTYEDAA